MKRSGKIAIVVIGACGIGYAIWVFGSGRQDVPRHKGEPVPEMVTHAVMGNGGVRPDHDLVNAIGSEAVPYLIDWFERADDAMAIFLEHLSHNHPEVFGAAVGGLIEAGDLKPSVPVKKAEEQLVKALRERAKPGDFLAAYVLGLLAAKSEGASPEAVSVLKAITDNPRAAENTRDFAVKALQQIEKEGN